MACGYISRFDVVSGDRDLWLLSPQSRLDSKLLSRACECAQWADRLYVCLWCHFSMINAHNLLGHT